jgi:hypothetical protein
MKGPLVTPVRTEPFDVAQDRLVEAFSANRQHIDKLSSFDGLTMHGHFDKLPANGFGRRP